MIQQLRSMETRLQGLLELHTSYSFRIHPEDDSDSLVSPEIEYPQYSTDKIHKYSTDARNQHFGFKGLRIEVNPCHERIVSSDVPERLTLVEKIRRH